MLRRGAASAADVGSLRDIDFQRWMDWLVRDGQLKPGPLEPAAVYTNESSRQGGLRSPPGWRLDCPYGVAPVSST